MSDEELWALGRLFDQARAWAATVDSDEQMEQATADYRTLLGAILAFDCPGCDRLAHV